MSGTLLLYGSFQAQCHTNHSIDSLEVHGMNTHEVELSKT